MGKNKVILLFFCLSNIVVFHGNIYCQNLNNTTWGTNISIPRNDFSKKDLIQDKSGFAENGYGFRLSSMKILNKQFDLVASIITNSYSVNKNIFNLYSISASQVTSYGKWFNFSFNFGLNYSLTFSSFNISLRLSPGIFFTSRPTIISFPHEIVNRGKGYSFIVIPELLICKKITEKTYLGLFLGYNLTRIKISYRKSLINDYEYKQDISAVDIGVILMFRKE